MTDWWLYSWGVGSISFGGASLLVPLYIIQLGASPLQLGILAATAATIGAPGAILFGRLANRVRHRRKLVLVTLATVAVALVTIPLLTSITGVIIVNAILWLVVAAIAPVLTMLVVDDVPESSWAERIGQLNKFQGYGWAGGLVLGTVWPVVGTQLVGSEAVTRGLFWLLAFCAGLSVLGAMRSLPRPDPVTHSTDRRQSRRIAQLMSQSRRGIKGATFVFAPNRLYWATRGVNLRRFRGRLNPGLVTYLIAAGLFFMGFAAFWAPLPLFLTEIGLDSGRIFTLYFVSSLASAVLYEPTGTIASRYDVRWLQSGSLASRGALIAGTALVAWGGTVGQRFLAAGLVLAAIGVTWAVIAVVGTAIVTRLSPPTVRGEALGVYTALGAVASGIGGVLGGWIATVGYLSAFTVAGGLVVLGAGLVFSIPTLPTGDQPLEADSLTPSEPAEETPISEPIEE